MYIITYAFIICVCLNIFFFFFSVKAVSINEQKLNTSCWNKACTFVYNRPGENWWARDFLWGQDFSCWFPLCALEKVCGVLRQGTKKTSSRSLTLKLLLLNFRSLLHGCLKHYTFSSAILFKAVNVFVGFFFNVSKPPCSLKPDAQHENFYLIWQNTKAKANVFRQS